MEYDKLTLEERTVIYKNQAVSISVGMMKKQKISRQALEHIKNLHLIKLQLYEEMQNTLSTKKLKILALKVQANEFALQKAWGFPEDSNMHRFWEVPRCKCPTMDNVDRLGTDQKLYNMHCIIHGTPPKLSLWRRFLNYLTTIK